MEDQGRFETCPYGRTVDPELELFIGTDLGIFDSDQNDGSADRQVFEIRHILHPNCHPEEAARLTKDLLRHWMMAQRLSFVTN